ncbi:MAG: hypothetical protein ACI831_000531 [Candidatus Azotimanducaceae bacterium]|jgi:hypothetical protein
MYALHNHNKMIDHDSCYYSPPLDHSLVSFRFVYRNYLMQHVHRITIISLCLILAACEPQDRRPGNWLSGELIETKVEDWRFSDDFPEVFIQTHPWYGVPHSVTVVLATANGKLFSPSIYYAEPKRFPDGKYWNRIVAKNPNIEVKIGDKLYPRSIHLVTDENEFEQGLEALANKYPFWRTVKDTPEETPTFVIMELRDRTE